MAPQGNRAAAEPGAAADRAGGSPALMGESSLGRRGRLSWSFGDGGEGVDKFPGRVEATMPATIGAHRNELRQWALDRLRRASPAAGSDRPYAFFGTDWFGVLQKCFWQTEELLERIVNLFLTFPSVATQPAIARMTKGRNTVQLTFAQCISFLGQVAYPSNSDLRRLVGGGYEPFLQGIEDELAALREVGKQRNEFTHHRLSGETGSHLCPQALSACVRFCESQLMGVAVLVERSRAEPGAAADRAGGRR
jgi:hypothetical protein